MNKKITHARWIELAKSLILIQNKLTDWNWLRVPVVQEKEGKPPPPTPPPPPSHHLSSPLPSDRVRDAGRETAIKLQPRPHGSVFFGKFECNRLCFNWQSSDLIATLFQIFLADYKISPKTRQRRPGTTSTVFVLYFPRPLSVLCKWESFPR